MTDDARLCEISSCGMTVRETTIHPQRGELAVCHLHAKHIRSIPEGRFTRRGGVEL